MILSIFGGILNEILGVADRKPLDSSNPDVFIVLMGIAIVLLILDLNVIANRIRDYDGNPWNALLVFIPIVNIGIILYYGIVRHKKEDVIQNNQDTINPSLAKAVKNHAEDIAEDTKENLKEYKVNHQTQKSKSVETPRTVVQTTIEEEQSDIVDTDEDAYYEQALQEIEEGNQVKSFWAKALVKSDGVESKSKSLYIKYRVEDLKNKEREKQLAFEALQKDNKLKSFLEENKLLNQVKKISKTKVIANRADSPIDVCIEFINGEWKIIADYNSSISYYLNSCR